MQRSISEGILPEWLLRDLYSDAQLLMRLGRESVSQDPTATTGQVVNVGQSRENESNLLPIRRGL